MTTVKEPLVLDFRLLTIGVYGKGKAAMLEYSKKGDILGRTPVSDTTKRLVVAIPALGFSPFAD